MRKEGRYHVRYEKLHGLAIYFDSEKGAVSQPFFYFEYKPLKAETLAEAFKEWQEIVRQFRSGALGTVRGKIELFRCGKKIGYASMLAEGMEKGRVS